MKRHVFCRTYLGLGLAVIFLATACRGTDAPGPQEADASIVAPTVAPTATRTAAPSATPKVATSVCSPVKTPMPTPVTPIPGYSETPEIVAERPPLTGRSGLVDTRFYSALLGQEMPILIYLPPGYYESSKRYPVLYMLSGFAGDDHEWVNWGMCDTADWLARGGQIQPMIVVMPDGDHSWWFNHAPVTGSDGKLWGDYIWKDVVGYVDANYRTLRDRESRAIGGLSAGGQAAFSLAMTHPEVFSVAGAHSPSVRGADGSLAIFGSSDYFQQYDIRWLFPNTQAWKTLDLWMDVGAGDTEWGDAVHDIHNMLVSLGIPHEWHDTWPGIHDDFYWSAHLADYLLWYSSRLTGE